jgi:hypothetical protein
MTIKTQGNFTPNKIMLSCKFIYEKWQVPANTA